VGRDAYHIDVDFRAAAEVEACTPLGVTTNAPEDAVSARVASGVQSVSGTAEWADVEVNCRLGCSHGCRYCYARAIAAKRGLKDPGTWTSEETTDVRERFFRQGSRLRVMFPTSHDITPENLPECVAAIQHVLEAESTGRVLLVSKPHVACIEAVCEQFREARERILFRFTIGSADDEVLRFWEPEAPPLDERLAALRLAYERGFATSVSCEPMLDTGVDKVIEAVRPLVTDSVWLGKPNKLEERLRLNGCDDDVTLARARKLLDDLDNAFIWRLYQRYSDDRLIKWKESIKRVVGLPIATVSGLDA